MQVEDDVREMLNVSEQVVVRQTASEAVHEFRLRRDELLPNKNRQSKDDRILNATMRCTFNP